MLTVVVLLSVAGAVAARGGHYSGLKELLNIISRDSDTAKDKDNVDFIVPDKPHLNNSVFCPMGEARQQGAEEAREEDYPWAARLLHSRRRQARLLCTAACVKENAFITALSCTATSKCTFTLVIYEGQTLNCDAYIFPQNHEYTKQWFDNVGVVTVVNRLPRWPTLPPQKHLRPLGDEGYTWLDELNLYHPSNTVVGFVANPENSTEHKLYVLRNVYMGNTLCHSILRAGRRSDDFYVPCYHGCAASQHLAGAPPPACDRLLAGLGHIVIDAEGVPVGVATWTCRPDSKVGKLPLPVGVSVPNSAALVQQLICADRIEDERARGIDRYVGICELDSLTSKSPDNETYMKLNV